MDTITVKPTVLTICHRRFHQQTWLLMRDPGSYEDIIDILVDEKVMEESDGLSLKALILLRKPLVSIHAIM